MNTLPKNTVHRANRVVAYAHALPAWGESLGFKFDYFEGMRIYNTFQAHQLLHWAQGQGKQTELKLALFEAFFSRRENVADVELLVMVAGRVGLDPGQALDVLTSGRYAEVVRREQSRWLDAEVHAVPTFFFNDSYPVPGAQEPRTLVKILEKLRDKQTLETGGTR